MSPIGPIPRHLSCFSLFSSQPSPFPLPFHSHWFSLFSQCRSRAVTLIHSPFDNSQNSHWSVFIHDEIRIVSRAASTEHPNPPSIASFWDSSENRVQPQRGWSCVFVFSSLFSTPCTCNLCSCYFPIFASFIILFSLFFLCYPLPLTFLPCPLQAHFSLSPKANVDNLRMRWEPLCIHSISLTVPLPRPYSLVFLSSLGPEAMRPTLDQWPKKYAWRDSPKNGFAICARARA